MINWAAELPVIRDQAEGHGVDHLFIAAIRATENGPPSAEAHERGEYGALVSFAPTYEEQCRAACATVRNKMVLFREGLYVLLEGPHYQRLTLAATFIHDFARSWAPLNDPEDKDHLNRSWEANCKAIYYGNVRRGAPA